MTASEWIKEQEEIEAEEKATHLQNHLARPVIQDTINFWHEVANTFNYQKANEWAALVADDKVDYFRNGGMAYDAVSAASNTTSGRYSPVKYDENMATLKRIINKYNISFQM